MSENERKEIFQNNSASVYGNLIPGARITVTPIRDAEGNETGAVNISVTCDGVVIPKDKIPALILKNTEEREKTPYKNAAKPISPKKIKTERRETRKLGKIGEGLIAIGAAGTLLAAAICLIKSCEPREQIQTTPLPSTTVAETVPLPSTTAPETVEETFTINGCIEEDFTVGGMFYYTPNPLNGDGVYEYNKESFENFQEDAGTVTSAMNTLYEYSLGSSLSPEQIKGSEDTKSLTDIAYDLCAGYYGQVEGDLAGTIIPGLGDQTLLDVNINGVLYQQEVANSNFERANQLYMGAQVIEQALNNEEAPAEGIDATSVDASLTFKNNETTRDAQVNLNVDIISGFSKDVGNMESAVREIENVLDNYAPYTNQIRFEFTITDSEGKRVERREYSGSKEEIIQRFQEDFELYYENTIESEPQLGDPRGISGDEVAAVTETQTRHGLDAALGKFNKLFSRGENER